MAGDELDLDTLRATAESEGLKVDGRWGVERLAQELEVWRKAERGEHHPPRSAEDSPPEGDPPAPDGESPSEDGPPADDDDDPDAGAGGTDVDELVEPELEASPAPASDGYIRAGGHIDRGDGRGWVLEEAEE